MYELYIYDKNFRNEFRYIFSREISPSEILKVLNKIKNFLPENIEIDELLLQSDERTSDFCKYVAPLVFISFEKLEFDDHYLR